MVLMFSETEIEVVISYTEVIGKNQWV